MIAKAHLFREKFYIGASQFCHCFVIRPLQYKATLKLYMSVNGPFASWVLIGFQKLWVDRRVHFVPSYCVYIPRHSRAQTTFYIADIIDGNIRMKVGDSMHIYIVSGHFKDVSVRRCKDGVGCGCTMRAYHGTGAIKYSKCFLRRNITKIRHYFIDSKYSLKYIDNAVINLEGGWIFIISKGSRWRIYESSLSQAHNEYNMSTLQAAG